MTQDLSRPFPGSTPVALLFKFLSFLFGSGFGCVFFEHLKADFEHAAARPPSPPLS
jgi:hypothetical protein